MKKLFLLTGIFALLFTACEQPVDSNNTPKLPSLTIINASSYDITDVKYSEVSFSESGSNDLRKSGGQSTKQLKVDSYSGRISFIIKEKGIHCWTDEIISIPERNEFRIQNNTLVQEIAYTSNVNSLDKITFLSKVSIEHGVLPVAKDQLLSLGEVTINTSKQIEFRLKNTGVGKLLLEGGTEPIKISGEGSNAFSVTQPLGSEIAPDGSLNFKLNFSPKVDQVYTATVTVNSNDPNGNFTFMVTATGVQPKPITSIVYNETEIDQEGTINAGEVLISQSKNVSVIIKNTGEALLTVDVENITITGADSGSFIKTTSPGSSISVGNQSSFIIECKPVKQGENNAVLTIPTNDESRNPIIAYLKVTGNRGSGVLELSQASTVIANNSLTPVDFGKVELGSYKSLSFTIGNTGNIAINLTDDPSVESSSAVFAVQTQPVNKILSPDSSTTFVIRYTPMAEGEHTSTITIGNSSDDGQFAFTVKGTGYRKKPQATVLYGDTAIAQNGTVNAGDVLITQSKNITAVIKNTGEEVLMIDSTNITITGADADAFVKTSNPGSSISVGGQSSFIIECKPTKEGENNATLTIPTNDDSRNPIVVFLKVTGQKGSAIAEVSQADTVIASKSLTPFDFGQIEIGTYKALTFTIKNTGNILLKLTGDPTVESSNAVFAVFTQPSNTTINPDATVSFILRYTPVAEGETTASITIMNNNDDDGQFVLNVKGTGYRKKPQATVSYGDTTIAQNGTVNTGEVLITQSKNITVIIKNTGEDVLLLDTTSITITGADADAFIKTSNPGSSISVGSQSSFIIECKPTKEGENNATLTIPTNDSSRNPIVVFLKVTGQKGYAILDLKQAETVITNNTLAPFDFGQVEVGTNKTLSFTIKNTGNIALSLIGEEPVESSSPVFTIQTQPVSKKLSSGSDTTFVVRYTPIAEGTHTSTITIGNNSDEGLFSFPVTGNGYVRKPLTVISYGSDEILQDGIIDAGEVLITTAKTISVIIKNDGDASLMLDTTTITMTGSDASAFTRTTTPLSTIAAGSQTSFNISCSPVKQGENKATIKIPTNDISRDPITINLKIIGVTPSATTLSVNTWADGNITTTDGEQWFSFTATAAMQYIHVNFGTLTNLYTQVYDNNGTAAGIETNLTGSTMFISRVLTVGQQYYIKVKPSTGSSGTFKIGFNASFVPPDITVTDLTANTWADGNIITTGGVQWFRFVANSATQYMHVDFGTLTNTHVQVYDNSGALIENEANLTGTTRHFSRTLTNGQTYYVRVRPASASGTFRITFNTSIVPPGAIGLTASAWTDSSIATSGGIQWFMFTATAATQYVHVDFGTLTNMYAQVYDNSGTLIENEANLTGTTRHLSRTLTNGQMYYIRVRPASGSGTFKITFNTVIAPPGAIGLTADVWTDGSIAASSGQQWFSFTAAAATQCIHAEFGTLSSLDILVYDSNSNTIGTETRLSGNTRYLVRTLETGQVYYVRVRPASGSGTYKIGYTASVLPPGTASLPLTANTWTNGSIGTSSDWQWFNFTATAATQYIHADFGTLANIYLQVYDSNGNVVGAETNLYGSTVNIARTLTIGQQYYIRVRPYSGSGAYKIAFNTIAIPPGAVVLTDGIQSVGSIASAGKVEWFSFEATAEKQFFHFAWGTLNDIHVQLYDSNGNEIGTEVQQSLGMNWFTRQLSLGETYYLRVRATSSSATGSYAVIFDQSILAAGVTATSLSINTWSNTTIISGQSLWYSFTATSTTQYIHFKYGTMTNAAVNLYDSNGNNISSGTATSSGGILTRSFQLTVGQTYYFWVLNGNTFNASIGTSFNSSSTPPN